MALLESASLTARINALRRTDRRRSTEISSSTPPPVRPRLQTWSGSEPDSRAGASSTVIVVEPITVSPALLGLGSRLQSIATRQSSVRSSRIAMWQKLIRAAVAAGAISKRFTFHDLRAYYTTQHKETTGLLQDLHASRTTTARVYERSKVAKRNAL